MSLSANELLFVVIFGYVGGVVSLLGLIGHALTMPALWRRDGAKMSNSTLYFFVCGIYSSFFLITNVVITSLHWVTYGIDKKSIVLYEFTIPAKTVGDNISTVFITGFIFTICLMCIDRCVDLVKPKQWACVFSAIKVRITVVVLTILSVLLTVPEYFTVEYFTRFNPAFNKTLLTSRQTEYATSYFHEIIYRWGIVNVYLVFGPTLITFLCCVVFVAEAASSAIQTRQTNDNILAFSPSTMSVRSSVPILVTRGIPSGHVFFSFAISRSTNQANISTISTVSQASSCYSGNEDSSRSMKSSKLGLCVNGITAIIFLIAMMTCIDRIVLALYIFSSDNQRCLNPQFASAMCAWVCALHHVLLLLNMSWNFVLFLFYDKKFRAGFVMTCRPRMVRRQLIGASFVMENKAFTPDVEIDGKRQQENKSMELERPQKLKLYCLYAPDIDITAEIPPAEEYMI